jgi:threonine dehydrogenase-like Zn-dependent dehydrogenase
MKATCWYGTNDVRVEEVADPEILNPRDAIVKISSTAICGSDLHLYDGYIPTMEKGDILGHEFMGEVVELGSAVKNLKVGDRVVVPFPISCGNCYFCQRQLFSLCENSNPNALLAEKLWGHSPAGIFGYSHLLGGYAGGQAEFARVPFADVGPIKIENGLPDDQVLFLSDILPTGYMAAENCQIQPGDTVAVWGCGPVGQFAIKSAFLLGAERVIAIDRFPERLQMAKEKSGAVALNYEAVDSVLEALKDMTGGRGPDACIDAVGMEAHGTGVVGAYDRVKQAVRLETDRPNVLREAILACRNAGTVSVAGVYGGFIDKVPFGSIMNRSLTIKSGQTHVHRYLRPLLERIQKGEIDPSFVITHHMGLDDAPKAYEMFRDKEDECIKVVLNPDHQQRSMKTTTEARAGNGLREQALRQAVDSP